MASKIVKINKEVWIPQIEEEISKWTEFSKSIFCREPENKRMAFSIANDLMLFLSMVETDSLTEKDFDHFSSYFC